MAITFLHKLYRIEMVNLEYNTLRIYRLDKIKARIFRQIHFFVCFFGKITIRIDVCGQRGQQLPTISTCYSGCVRERHIDPTSTYYLSGINVLLFSLLSSVEFVLFKNSDRRKNDQWNPER